LKKSCSYCGRIHDTKYICPAKRKMFKSSQADKFRSTSAWQHKRDKVKQRDLYLCQVCVRAIGSDTNPYASRSVSVHHIIPLHEDFSRRLDDSNLITLCDYHHRLADDGKIPARDLLSMVAEQRPPAYDVNM
jgi:hypothetical protein